MTTFAFPVDGIAWVFSAPTHFLFAPMAKQAIWPEEPLNQSETKFMSRVPVNKGSIDDLINNTTAVQSEPNKWPLHKSTSSYLQMANCWQLSESPETKHKAHYSWLMMTHAPPCMNHLWISILLHAYSVFQNFHRLPRELSTKYGTLEGEGPEGV